MRRILVTSALPYANGSIHLGHLVEYIQTDIWARSMRAMGHKVTYVCADDAHGTAIMLRAEKLGVSPESLIEGVKAEHEADFATFHIGFDHYGSTHCAANQELASQIYLANKRAGNIGVRSIEQLFDPEKGLFLADRFVKGECPRCGALDQYGDNCESCGATYQANELKNPKSTLSGATPVLKSSEHHFFELPKFEAFLKQWMNQDNRLQPSIKNKLAEWFENGLNAWDISRDAPYFGFEIPEAPGKYFYVWLDAPVGYMASFKELCATQEDLEFDDYWNPESKTELYHFIGKDIVYFHALFWPAMLEGAGFRKPNGVFAHGFLTVNGEKMSKSRGTFIKASDYAKHLDTQSLRYYFASKLSAQVEDLNLDLDDFVQKVNSDLVGKVVNIASRSAGFIHKHFDSQLSAEVHNPELIGEFQAARSEVEALYEAREFSKAMRVIMKLADSANAYIDQHKPWQLIKEDSTKPQAHLVCSTALNAFRMLMVYLSPVLPIMATKAAEFLNAPVLSFTDIEDTLSSHTINPFEPLMARVDAKDTAALVEASKDTLASEATPAKTKQSASNQSKAKASSGKEAAPSNIEFADFAKVELKAAKVVEASVVDGADKLLKLILDLGDHQRQVFSGIRSSYPDPQALVGQTLVCVSNLAPRKMRFGMSEGMVLAGGSGDSVRVVTLDNSVPAGSVVS